jgi:cellulose synthase/poly-beta-1,6-N-acetylglucosamine synthase-like glycosyltransferase
LLGILRGIIPNFETGDLLITVALMKAGGKIALYKDIISLTYVPENIKELFNQRRRWERGTIKVIVQEIKFYSGLFAPPTMLSVALVLHMVLYVGLGIVIASLFFPNMLSMDEGGGNAVMTKASIITSYYVWFTIDVTKAAWVALKTEPKRFPLFLICAFANAPVWIFIVTPARLFGGIEAIFDLAKERIGWRKNIAQ